MLEEKYGNFSLDSYDPIELTLPDFSVSSDEIEEEMGRIALRHAAYRTVSPRPIRAGDTVQLSLVTSEGAHPFPGLTNGLVDVQLGRGLLPVDIEEALIGHVVGDVVCVEFEYVDYSETSSSKETPFDGGCGSCKEDKPQGVKLVSKVEVLALREVVVPEITDAWVQEHIALSNSVEQFRERTKRKISVQKRREYANQVEFDVVAEIGKRLVGEVPHDAVVALASQMKKEFIAFLEQYDTTLSAYLATQALSEDQFAAHIEGDSRARIRQDIALASYARHSGINLDDVDINAMFSQPTPEGTYESRRDAERAGDMDRYRDLALRAKVAETLTCSAVFKTGDGQPDESFTEELGSRYAKRRAARAHAAAEPRLQIPTRC